MFVSAWGILSVVTFAIWTQTSVGAVEDDLWIQGTLFFHTPDHHGIVEQALQHGSHLSRDDLISLGLEETDVEAITDVMLELGGKRERVSGTRDWMHIRFPSEHMSPPFNSVSSSFLHKSKEATDESHHWLVHRVAQALQDQKLEHLVSHMTLHMPQDNQSMSKDRIWRRQLRQQPSSEENQGPDISVILAGRADPYPYSLFIENESEAIKNISCSNNPVFVVTCQGEDGPYYLGSNSTADCLLGVAVSLQRKGSVEGGLETIRFSKKDLEKHRKTCADLPEFCDTISAQEPAPLLPTSYVYGLPICQYAIPLTVYDIAVMATMNSPDGPTFLSNPENGYILNQFPASPVSLREFYGVDPTFQGSPETVQASTLFSGSYAVNETSINKYLSLLGLDPHSQLRFSDFAGGDANNASKCLVYDCSEPMMDVETQQSFAPNATTYFTPSTSGGAASDGQTFLLNFFDDVIMADPKIQVASISIAFDPVAPNFPIQVFEESLRRIAASGISILVASGDAGASALHNPSNQCLPGTDALVGNYINQSWPAVSPWVTSVGATQILAIGDEMKATEVACSISTGGGITSGGGFSGVWLNVTTPSWQKPFVEQYLSKNQGNSGFPTKDTPGYNPNGRGYPDIAMYGADFPLIYSSGLPSISGGTSLSAPMAASLFTLTNEQLLKNGYQVIGYANPMLYWMAGHCPDAFTDITIGNNQAGQKDSPCLYGFNAAPGWDPVTGLGSINFPSFVKCAMRWQDEQKNAKTSAP